MNLSEVSDSMRCGFFQMSSNFDSIQAQEETRVLYFRFDSQMSSIFDSIRAQEETP